MTSTQTYQSVPDFYLSPEECRAEKKYISSNPRYTKFTQVHFTAADVNQFFSHKDPTNGINPNPEISLEENIWAEHIDVSEYLNWPKYKNINAEAVTNTFRYLFEKFKKGVFIKIKDNKLAVFLPFSKINYTNEWGNRMRIDPAKYSGWSLSDFLIHASKVQDPVKFAYMRKENVHENPHEWYGNNCLIRPERPTAENDRGLCNLKDMLTTLCETRLLPDIELFLNKRDFPLIKKDDTEPYEHIFDSEKTYLLSHEYEKYCPILSSVSTSKNADIPFPTAEDWARVSNQEDGKWFTANCQNYRHNFNMDWSSKRNIAVFRGSSTGCGTTIETNPRLRLSSLAITPTGKKLIDAGITTWNIRPRKNMNMPYLQLIEKETLPFWRKDTDGLVPKLTPEQQSNYKYIINVDGHVSAFRLSLELSMGSVILLVDSKYKMWFRKYLIENVHFIAVKEDLSDLFEKIQWCREHDSECEQIAKNAKQFYDTFLTKKGVLDYIQSLFISIKKTTGTYFYNTVSVQDVIYKDQMKKIVDIQKDFYDPDYDPSLGIEDYLVNPIKTRNIDVMDAIQSLFRKNPSQPFVINESAVHSVHKSKDTALSRVTLSDIPFVVKDTSRKYENVNEAFAGIFEINKLLREIPNFKYTFYINKEGSLYSEYIYGKTLKQYITDGCSLTDMCNSLVMITLALAVAQERCGFIHYDLYPWNIVMMPVKKQTITYQFKKYIFQVETDIIPVIIDYGKSHIITKGRHYGTIEPFKTSTIQDIFCLIVGCLNEYLQIFRPGQSAATKSKELECLLYIANFLSNTEFQKKKIEKIDELKNFLSVHKKYNEMIYSNKCSLEHLTPTDYLFYILEGFEMHIVPLHLKIDQIEYPQKVKYPFKLQSYSFYYDIMTSRDPSGSIQRQLQNIKETCLEIVNRSGDILTFVEACNMTSVALQGTLQFIQEYLPKYDTTECKNLLRNLTDVYQQNIHKKSRDLAIGYININERFTLAKYNVGTFSVPEKILNLLQSHKNVKMKKEELISLREMFMNNIFYDMPYKIPNELEFSRKYARISHISPLTLLNYNASVNSIEFISKKIYKKDKKELKKLSHPPQKTLETLTGILNLIS